MLRAVAAVLTGALALVAPAGAHPSRGIVVLGDGTVLFSDLVRIRAISPRGKMRTVRMNSRDGRTHALSLAADGSIWGEQSRYDPATRSYTEAIWRMLPDGSLTFRYGPTKRIERGVGLIRDRQGCTWHADRTDPPQRRLLVHRKCPGRAAERMFGSASDDAGFKPVLVADAVGAALAPDGGFLVRDGTRLRRLAPGGRASVVASGLSADDFGIAAAPGGAVLIAEYSRRRVVWIGPKGQRRVLATSQAPWAPTGVATRFGALYVLEAADQVAGRIDRVRVRRIAPNGADKVLGTAEVNPALEAGTLGRRKPAIIVRDDVVAGLDVGIEPADVG